MVHRNEKFTMVPIDGSGRVLTMGEDEHCMIGQVGGFSVRLSGL